MDAEHRHQANMAAQVSSYNPVYKDIFPSMKAPIVLPRETHTWQDARLALQGVSTGTAVCGPPSPVRGEPVRAVDR